VFAVDELTITLVPTIEYNHASRSIGTFLYNVLMLQDFPYFKNILIFSKTTYGSGFQLWTLPPEWFMYMVFGFFFYKLYSKKTRFRIPLCVFALFCAIVPFANFVYGRGNGLSISWLAGVLIYYAFSSLKDRKIPKNRIIWVAGLAFVAGILRIAGVKRNMGIDYDPLYTIGMAICILCGLLLTSRATRNNSRLQSQSS
jgi:peptidoglycan/LPS O-acetylase OafA/YrhL